MNHKHRHIPRFLRPAFTLVEVLVVISIFVLLLAIAVPAFSSMLYSSEQSLVENSVRIALSTARNYAAKSPSGQDSAAVFLYDYESKKTSILICTFAGTIQDKPPLIAPPGVSFVLRDVFAAAPGTESIQLTSGWTIRGYAPGDTIDASDTWYERTYPQSFRAQGNWLFPETSFYDDTSAGSPTSPTTGRERQSFMIRFEGGTGMVKTASPNSAMVYHPSTSLTLHSNWPPLPNGGSFTYANSPLNPENESDGYRYVRRVLAWPNSGPAPTLNIQQKRAILGDGSPDAILCKSIGQIALCSERRLARAIGVETDPTTGCIYKNPASLAAPQPEFLTNVDIDNVNAWIEGHLTDTNGDTIDSDCRIFTIQRYLGWLQEVTGTQNGQGVGS